MKAYGAWAVGSIASDGLICEQHPQIASKKSILVGHSQNRKSLRFGLQQNDPSDGPSPMPMNLACGGEAISRKKYGETVEAITTRFPTGLLG